MGQGLVTMQVLGVTISGSSLGITGGTNAEILAVTL